MRATDNSFLRRSPLRQRRLLFCIVVCALVISACSDKTGENKDIKKAAATLITVTQAKAGAIETSEETLGTLETLDDPRIAAEVAGRVDSIAVKSGQAIRRGQVLAQIDPVDAELGQRVDEADRQRLSSLLAQHERVVERQQQLVNRNFISRNALDDAIAQRDALKKQLEAGTARAGLSRRNVDKTLVRSPLDGVVDERMVAVGDFLKVGDTMFRLLSSRSLRANLPFSEAAAQRIRVGQPVRLFSPFSPQARIEARIGEVRPGVSESGRTVVAMVPIGDLAGWRPGSTVNATVIISQRSDAVLVPEQSLVLRPAGKVVYLVVDEKAQQRVVETGARQAGFVEITRGLSAGETIAVDGAGFLANGAAVTIKEAKSADGRKEGALPLPGIAGASKEAAAPAGAASSRPTVQR